MRRKNEAVLRFDSSDDGLPKVVRDYRARYRAISQVLDKNPEVLDAVHGDLKRLSQGNRRGRSGDFTSENILRASWCSTWRACPSARRSSGLAAIPFCKTSCECGRRP